LGLVVAGDTAVQSMNNEITIDNFLHQAPNHKILEPRNNIQDNNRLINRYEDLYTFLVNQNIIVAKVEGLSTLFTWSPKFKVKDNLTEEEVKKALDPTNEHYTSSSTNAHKYLKEKLEEMIKLYTIHLHRLFHFLKNYKYNASDQVGAAHKMITGKTGGKNKKSKFYKNKRSKIKTRKHRNGKKK
jgi:hypothetical protein